MEESISNYSLHLVVQKQNRALWGRDTADLGLQDWKLWSPVFPCASRGTATATSAQRPLVSGDSPAVSPRHPPEAPASRGYSQGRDSEEGGGWIQWECPRETRGLRRLPGPGSKPGSATTNRKSGCNKEQRAGSRSALGRPAVAAGGGLTPAGRRRTCLFLCPIRSRPPWDAWGGWRGPWEKTSGVSQEHPLPGKGQSQFPE